MAINLFIYKSVISIQGIFIINLSIKLRSIFPLEYSFIDIYHNVSGRAI